VAVTLRDISDRKRTQELTKAREQAEEASRLKSQLLANISHEFYTPMNQILGLTEMTLETEVSEEQRENLQLLRASAGELMGVLQNVLDFSGLESGKVALVERPVGVSGLLHDVFALLGPPARQKGLRLDAAVSLEVPEVIVADGDRLRQVLLQVVGNGIKFTPSGEVTVSVAVEGAAWLRFSVRDTGVGVPASKRETIFDPFVQADGSSTRSFGGTGLGLAIARGILERMGGRIWLERELCRGSVFCFSVPLRQG
jgi:two-component system sensor histidine kinase/response regulator